MRTQGLNSSLATRTATADWLVQEETERKILPGTPGEASQTEAEGGV
jgi:hypothetical protein